jgi:PKD repeat protein
MNRFFTTKLTLLLVAAVTFSFAAMATHRKVFFIGNSYTFTNSMPDMLKNFALAKGDTITWAMSAPAGYTFNQHTTNSTTLSGITSQPWDIIVLQEQSQLPSFSPAQVATDVYPYAKWLDSTINEQDSCIETMFMMTWGRKNGDAANCPSYPVICTYAGMQLRLRESYTEMAFDNHASISPVGAAWKVVVDSFPAINLYQTDESHPSVAGSYLQACVFYASIFHKSAQGNTYLGGLTASVAATLQRIADKVVLDSLNQWQQYGHYPYAKFGKSKTGTMVNFTNNSQRGTSYSWKFGDGGTSTATAPAHNYTAPGVYTVTLTVSNECFTTSTTDTVRIGTTTSVNDWQLTQSPAISVMTLPGGTVSIVLPDGAMGILQVYSIDGKPVTQYPQASGTVTQQLPAGMYVYRFYSGTNVYTGRFGSY